MPSNFTNVHGNSYDVQDAAASTMEAGESIWTAAKEGLQSSIDNILEGMGYWGSVGVTAIGMAPALAMSAFSGHAAVSGITSALGNVAGGMAAAPAPMASSPATQIALPTEALQAVEALRANESLSFMFASADRSELGTGTRHGVVQAQFARQSVALAA